MPVPFACPHCGEQTLVDEQFAGHSGPCIACGKLIIVPQFAIGSLGTLAASPQQAQFASSRRRYVLIGLCTLAAVAAVTTIVSLLAGPVLDAAQSHANRRACSSNLRQIGQALFEYEKEHRSLPPAIITDASGKPLYSWRVAILPYLGPEGRKLHSQFRLDEPWDSPANRQLLKQMPKVFRSPGDVSAAPDETSYVVIAGGSTPFPPGRRFTRNQIIDGQYNTILVVEVAKSGIAWSQPKDLVDTQLSFQIGIDIGGNHQGGVNALFADGVVRFLPDTLSGDEVAELTTANGREQSRVLDSDY